MDYFEPHYIIAGYEKMFLSCNIQDELTVKRHETAVVKY